MTVLTDEKWLQLVVEQVLSNAVKYAPGGRVTMRQEMDALLIEDNGIGIAQEDLPRVFEQGFTGYNGRVDNRSTGIGLYLCRQIAGNWATPSRWIPSRGRGPGSPSVWQGHFWMWSSRTGNRCKQGTLLLVGCKKSAGYAILAVRRCANHV